MQKTKDLITKCNVDCIIFLLWNMCFNGNQTNLVSVQSEESVVEITKTPDIAKKHADSIVNKVHFTSYDPTFLLWLIY